MRQRYNFWVYDNSSIGYVIGDVNATDADSGQFGLIQYRIINDVNDYFSIDPTTVRQRRLGLRTDRRTDRRNCYS